MTHVLTRAGREAERQALLDALEAAGGRRDDAAQRLGLSRRSFYYRLNRHGISLPRKRGILQRQQDADRALAQAGTATHAEARAVLRTARGLAIRELALMRAGQLDRAARLEREQLRRRLATLPRGAA